jgi:hypothetical protein
MPNHNISFVKASETKKNDAMNVDIDDENIEINEQNPQKGFLVLIETQPFKGRTKKVLDISFSSKDIIRNAPYGPIYIAS